MTPPGVLPITVRRTPTSYSVKVVGSSPKVIIERDPSTGLVPERIMRAVSEDMHLVAALVVVEITARDKVSLITPNDLLQLVNISRGVQP